METEMQNATERNFILQQGFEQPAPTVCVIQYSALQFQPRIVLVWLLAGVCLQSPVIFGTLCAALWWSALLPKLNPFDALYNRTLGRRRSAFRLSPAPAPRRMAQTMAGAFALACTLLTYFNFTTPAYVIEAVFLAAVLALVLGSFCLGSFIYHLFRGRGSFARKTLPWAR
jgi:Domain of unknown function (DUF4395)